VPTLSLPLVLRALGAVLLGVVVGAVGTVLHRSIRPWGVVVCLLLVLAAAVTARAWAGWVASVGLLVGLFATVQVLSGRGPGGDVLVPADGAIGWVWAVGALLVALGVALAPRSWFADVPLRRPRAGTP
jgi:hypothetical protein